MSRSTACWTIACLLAIGVACGSASTKVGEEVVAGDVVDDPGGDPTPTYFADAGGPDVCEPSCLQLRHECGGDGCGGNCGECGPGWKCKEGSCLPADGPGGIGWPCESNEECLGGFGYCIHTVVGQACTYTCPDSSWCPEGWECKGDNSYADTVFYCVPECVPECDGRECGDDGCAGSCGECDATDLCRDDGQCRPATCAIILDCFEDCPEDDESCFEKCFYDAPAEVQKAYQDLAECHAGRPPPDVACWYMPDTPEREECWKQYYQYLFDMCADEYYACWPLGDGSCVESYVCLYSCADLEEGGEKCQEYCFADASLDALEQWDTYVDCLFEAGLAECPEGDFECYDVVFEQCDAEAKECAHGEMSCAEMLGCMDDCGADSEVCMLTCQVYGSIPAQETYEMLDECLEAECGEEPDDDCLSAATAGPCADEHADCLGCEPDCEDKECGADGCGGICGTCYPGLECQEGMCSSPPIDCEGKECGDDGWGGSCGECANGCECSPSGICLCE